MTSHGWEVKQSTCTLERPALGGQGQALRPVRGQPAMLSSAALGALAPGRDLCANPAQQLHNWAESTAQAGPTAP